ncbi:MAG: hypothetical protein MRZ79_00545 [Bacteroidia bacterium]|nr:hypothetical protein [Bacteroidia bacterium]
MPEKRDSQGEQTSTQNEAVKSQCIIVVTDNWDTANGKLYTFSKKGSWGKWVKERPVIDVLIGKKGLGWGIGIDNFKGNEGPKKKEGDLKSPAGIFQLSNAFGYSKGESNFNWPYMQIIPSTMCIEDGDSRFYNRIIDEDTLVSDWRGTDHMLRKDDLYEWGVFVEHNPNQVNGSGSCIFLHVWRPGGSGTAGCTSMDKSEMKKLIQWLDSEAEVLLVQCPRSEYSKLQSAYSLPSIYD